MDNIKKLPTSSVPFEFLAASIILSLTFMTVAPSFVMVCLPFASTSSRSPPYGPKVLFMVDCTAKQALILEMTWPFPCD